MRLGLRMVRGLANADAARIVAARADQPFTERRRSLAPRRRCRSSSLVRLAEADAFRPSLGLARREALWAIKALRDEPLPLFAAAVGRERPRPCRRSHEPAVDAAADDRRRRGRRGLRPCRPDAARPPGRVPARGSAPPAHRHLRRGDAGQRRPLADGSPASCWCARCRAPPRASCSSPSRTRPASPTSSSGRACSSSSAASSCRPACWRCRAASSARARSSISIAQRLHDLSGMLASVGERDAAFPLPHGRGDEFHHGSPGPTRATSRPAG